MKTVDIIARRTGDEMTLTAQTPAGARWLTTYHDPEAVDARRVNETLVLMWRHGDAAVACTTAQIQGLKVEYKKEKGMKE